MSKKRFYYLSILLGYLLLFQSFICGQIPDPSPTPEDVPPDKENSITVNPTPQPTAQTEKILIHFGDLVDVDIVGSTEYDWRGRLTPEGFLSGINFIEEPIYALCRSEAEVAADIAKGYGKILQNPQVVVKVIDRTNRPISFLYGAVRTPQRFKIQRPVRLNELLILSGGVTERASGEIQILRSKSLNCEPLKSSVEEQTTGEAAPRGKLVSANQEGDAQYINIKISELIKGDQSNNPLILSGDVITVSEAETIYVMGGVVSPKQLTVNSKITLSRAITAAGGFTKNADRRKIIIFRREKTETKIIEVDFETISAAGENDVELQALDIIEVPQSGRSENRLPPVINVAENKTDKSVNPPLRIID